MEGQNATLCVAEFQDDNAYLKSDMALFYKNMAEPAYNITDVGPYSTNGGPDAESSLDIQFGGALARGAHNYFWVDLTWWELPLLCVFFSSFCVCSFVFLEGSVFFACSFAFSPQTKKGCSALRRLCLPDPLRQRSFR